MCTGRTLHTSHSVACIPRSVIHPPLNLGLDTISHGTKELARTLASCSSCPSASMSNVRLHLIVRYCRAIHETRMHHAKTTRSTTSKTHPWERQSFVREDLLGTTGNRSHIFAWNSHNDTWPGCLHCITLRPWGVPRAMYPKAVIMG